MSNIVLVDINHNLNYQNNQKIKLLYHGYDGFFDENGNYVGNILTNSDNENPYKISLFERRKIPKNFPLTLIVKDMKMTKKPVPSEAYLLQFDKKLEKNIEKQVKKERKDSKVRENCRIVKDFINSAISYFVASLFGILAIILSILSLILNNWVN